MLSALDRQHSVAPPGFSRWLIPPAALSVHLCIGQVYATSVYKNSFVDHFDASAASVGIIFSYRSRRSTSLGYASMSACTGNSAHLRHGGGPMTRMGVSLAAMHNGTDERGGRQARQNILEAQHQSSPPAAALRFQDLLT